MKQIVARFGLNLYAIAIVMAATLPAFFAGESLALFRLHFKSGLNLPVFIWLVQLGGFLYTALLAVLVYLLFQVERFRRLRP